MIEHPVVIIGAGFSGITSLKQCLENGLNAICYEKTENYGGLWRFRESDDHGLASVMRSTVINTSKEASAFSDFPPDPKYANFMHNSVLIEYLTSYMRHFDLEPHINYGYEVLKVHKSDDYDDTGNWVVKVKNKEGTEMEVVASGVIVAIGHHVFPNQPSFKGLSEFRGKVLHSHSFKNYKGYENSTALVVGIGNSAVDVAVELSQISSKVFLSTRRGAWFLRRVGSQGMPFDYALNRYLNMAYKYFPNSTDQQLETKANNEFDHAMYNLKPAHRFFSQHPTISDAIPKCVISGLVVVKGDISHFTPEGVVFKGEEDEVVPVDVVITATGYDIFMPILEGIIPVKRNHVNLYARVFPPELEHPTLAVIGLIQPIGCIFPIAELQARWFCRLLKKEVKLPPVPERLEEIRVYKKSLEERYVVSPRHTIQVDFLPYMDMLAEAVGCKPNLLKKLFTDPVLFYKLMFGPPVAYQFRLCGPHSWPEARKAIMTVTDRTCAPFSTRSESTTPAKRKSGLTLPMIITSVVVTAVVVIGTIMPQLNTLLSDKF